MFYPEFSQSMKWQLHNPRIYSNFVFPNCGKQLQFQDENDQNFGKFIIKTNYLSDLAIICFPPVLNYCLLG